MDAIVVVTIADRRMYWTGKAGSGAGWLSPDRADAYVCGTEYAAYKASFFRWHGWSALAEVAE